jgi:hypothetical protein
MEALEPEAVVGEQVPLVPMEAVPMAAMAEMARRPQYREHL